MYANLSEDFFGKSICYTKTEGDNMYYVQIINPTDTEICDAFCTEECNAVSAFVSMPGGALCL